MIVADTSAIVAVLRKEQEADRFASIISEADRCFLSAVGLLEMSIVMIGGGRPQLADRLDRLIGDLSIEIVPFDEQQALEGRSAFIRFGKGHHPAGLNFGDCASYALARTRSLPLLFKGEDFAKTDVRSAL